MVSERIEQSSARSVVCAAARCTMTFAIGPSARASSRSAVRSVSSSHDGVGFCSISVPMATIVVPAPSSTSTDICATSRNASRNACAS